MARKTRADKAAQQTTQVPAESSKIQTTEHEQHTENRETQEEEKTSSHGVTTPPKVKTASPISSGSKDATPYSYYNLPKAASGGKRAYKPDRTQREGRKTTQFQERHSLSAREIRERRSPPVTYLLRWGKQTNPPPKKEKSRSWRMKKKYSQT